MRWLAATITASLILVRAAIPADAFSFEVLAAPTTDFDILVRSTPSAKQRADTAAKAVTKQGGTAKHALGIVGGASARLKGVGVLKLTRDADVDYVARDRHMRAQFDPALDSAKALTPGILEVNAPQVWSQLG